VVDVNEGVVLTAEDYARIDAAIADAKRWERWIIGMSVGIFLLGTGALIWGLATRNAWLGGPAAIADAFLYWPITKLIKMRKETIALAVSPGLIKGLPPEDAVKEMVKLLESIRS
jgi:hypothetical protein